MILISLNLRGVGGTLKSASFRRVLDTTNPNIVFLQETLVEGDKAKSLFLQCLPHWNAIALDSQGHSGGLLSGWNPAYAEFCAFGTSLLAPLQVYISKEDLNSPRYV